MNDFIPVYVTRKTAGGTTGQIAMRPFSLRILKLLIQINIFGWSIYGIVELISKAVDAV